MANTTSCTKLTVLTLTAVIIQIAALSLFVFSFFPVKPALSGVSGLESFYAPHCNPVVHNQTETDLKSLYQELSQIPPLFDRLIFMVIDGLPAEFLLGKDEKPPRDDLIKAMPYTQSLLNSGMAVGYHAKAAPPTVTMPRLKAMVSGAIGGFLDVAFNFNTQALLDDNLLDQFFRIGWKMIMLGDETWLKLFPELFVRYDGVSSFFVKDTVQVDQNVSRHLRDELHAEDWKLLILHYLGLDHVGHIGGRSSSLMCPKLTEMDEVVKMIHLSSTQMNADHQAQTLLVVVSDHGMTENGNHGGSSFEETDSLALFVGLKNGVSDYKSATHNFVHQVDIAPTLALLFGVPIPKNNVGVLISGTFDSFTDDQQLRALELNSWQLLRLLEAELPGLSCEFVPCDGFSYGASGTGDCSGSMENIFCCLYTKAANLHNFWKLKKKTGSKNWDDFSSSVAAYYEFLNTASEWLSRRVTDKPVSSLAFGVVAMILSSLMLLSLIICLSREVHPGEKQYLSSSSNSRHRWPIDETFILCVVLILVVSMGSSSMVEEEQYIWNFVISTSYLLLLRKLVQFLPGSSRNALGLKGCNGRSSIQMSSILLLLISGRILRGWHQGGVNWTHLSDISKWLEHGGSKFIGLIQLVSGLLVLSLGLFASSFSRSKRKIVQVVGFYLLISGLLVLWHIMEYQDNSYASSNYHATILAQIIYAILGIGTISTVVAVPWIMPIWNSAACSRRSIDSLSSASTDNQYKSPLLEFKYSSYLIGLAYMLCWCLLQLLLQQPINSMPIFLLLMQILTSMLYYSHSSPRSKEWLEVALLYYLGMAGHFALGNSNTLATIDVAGAFMGLSSHSTLLSGILMFIITYASPMLVLLSMVMYISVKDDASYAVPTQTVELGQFLKVMLGFPCLVPLGLNSILLTAYTIVLLLMRNHLFVWSVFSPKFLYVCATTICIYIGVFVVAVTEIYVYMVLVLRRKIQVSGDGIR
ncbi:GPI ethanolamine phosphate transferase 2 [Mercurialis annua]|uniref:GPI ethanolamine phosphate transferase 2 n=1 Tax=Mercurialis annua TaxID=3986 RepID=UPI00215F1301|nr:GPI ethanolamine phosphate transferase 2 [Mercurialis annua]